MDDGHYTNYGLILQTNAFTVPDVNLLVQVLYTNFHLKSQIRFEKGQPII